MRSSTSSTEIRGETKPKTCERDGYCSNICPVPSFIPFVTFFLGGGGVGREGTRRWMMLNLFSSFLFLTFLFLYKLFHAFHLILELSVSFSNQNTFRCHWHLAAVISVDYFVSVEVWMTSQSFECNTRKWCNRTFEIQVLLVHVPTPLQSLLPFIFYLFHFQNDAFFRLKKFTSQKVQVTN